MTMAIWKYRIPYVFGTENKVIMPKDSLVVHVGSQQNDVFVWAIIQPDKPGEERFFHLYSTGEEIVEEKGKRQIYVGTAQVGDYVWHVFEEAR